MLICPRCTLRSLYKVIKKVSVHLMITVQNNPHKTDELKMAFTEYNPNVDRDILNAVFENTVQCVNKCLETGGGHCEHYL